MDFAAAFTIALEIVQTGRSVNAVIKPEADGTFTVSTTEPLNRDYGWIVVSK